MDHQSKESRAAVREATPYQQQSGAPVKTVVKSSPPDCQDCKAQTAFHYWKDQPMTPSFNWEIDFTGLVNVPAGKRAVVELVTATIQVPAGEWARLRMFTSLGFAASNFDLTVTPQNAPGKPSILMATHPLRAYSDHLIAFNVNRDNATTSGDAFICISGYLVDG